MKKLLFSLLALSFLLLFSCKKETPQEPAEALQTEESRYTAPLDFGELTDRSSCPWEVLPPGSVNALAAAIANICDGGVIYLKAGLHTETEPLTITKPVKIIGESGAVLKIAAAVAIPATAADPVKLNPALHFLNAPGSLVQDLEIEPIGDDGGNAILMENSHGSGVMRNKINDFQFSIVVEKSDRMTIMFNNVKSSLLGLTQVAPAHGIVMINGTSAYLSDNEVTRSVFGIWACDRWGTLERNHTYGNYVGQILCNVPAAYQLPSGEITGSQIPATGWKARNNKSHDNFYIGYLVIDGANQNLLENNEGGNNTDYDMELTTDTYRFGFLTPAAYKNTVNAGAYNITIKNCGPNNTINGGTWVDTTVDVCN